MNGRFRERQLPDVGPLNRGLANGYVVSLYPLGAMLGAPALGWSIQVFGVRPTLTGQREAMAHLTLLTISSPSVCWRSFMQSIVARRQR